MPQATEELRTRWGGDDGIGPDKAEDHLLSRGFVFKMGLIQAPFAHMWSDDDSTAVRFLIDEWDYAYVGSAPILRD